MTMLHQTKAETGKSRKQHRNITRIYLFSLPKKRCTVSQNLFKRLKSTKLDYTLGVFPITTLGITRSPSHIRYMWWTRGMSRISGLRNDMNNGLARWRTSDGERNCRKFLLKTRIAEVEKLRLEVKEETHWLISTKKLISRLSCKLCWPDLQHKF